MVSTPKGILSTIALFAAGLWVLKPKEAKAAEISQQEITARQQRGFEPLVCEKEECENHAAHRFYICDEHYRQYPNLIGKIFGKDESRPKSDKPKQRDKPYPPYQTSKDPYNPYKRREDRPYDWPNPNKEQWKDWFKDYGAETIEGCEKCGYMGLKAYYFEGLGWCKP